MRKRIKQKRSTVKFDIIIDSELSAAELVKCDIYSRHTVHLIDTIGLHVSVIEIPRWITRVSSCVFMSEMLSKGKMS